MCGISGIINLSKKNNSIANQKNISKMTNVLEHRGPDAINFWTSYHQKVFFGHTRLAVQDLSSNGSQPMESFSNKYVVVFNGEIYNHEKLRQEINFTKIVQWKSFSDTETLVNYIDHFGLIEFLSKAKGMYAFSIYDKEKEKVYLIRDRFGEKPLYYGLFNNQIYFASQLKSFLEVFNNLELDPDSIRSFLQLSYIPSPLSIFKKIKKLPPASMLTIDLKDSSCNFKIEKWWSLENEILRSKQSIISSKNQALYLFEQKIFNAVEQQLISNVPVGCFLSGGVDSTIIAHTMSNISKKKIETFSIGFDNKNYDESSVSKETSKSLSTNHNELILSNNKKFHDIVENIFNYYDEPFADSSQIPTILLSKFVKTKVTVCLTGDGGDEVFAGYNRYFMIEKIWKFLSKFNNFSKKTIILLLESLPNIVLSKIIFIFFQNNHLLNEKIYKTISAIKKSKNVTDFYKNILSVKNSEIITDEDPFFNLPTHSQLFSDKELMMINDYKNFLPDDILCKVDRASMASSLETRIPFLDIDIFKFSWMLPMEMKISKDSTKIFLKTYLNKKLPKYPINKPKQGFSIPLADWLRNDFQYMINDMLKLENLSMLKLDNIDKILSMWEDFKSNKSNLSEHLIWNIFVLLSWVKNYKKNIKF